MKLTINFLITIVIALIIQSTAQAQVTSRFECSYQARARLSSLSNFGNLPPNSMLSLDWHFSIVGQNNTIPTVGSNANIESGEIIFSHETEGSLTYSIQSVTVRNNFFSDQIITTYSNPVGELGGVSPAPNSQNLSLTNSNQATGIFNILINENYPTDSNTLNQFSNRAASITQIDFNGIVRTVSASVGEITGGCIETQGQQIFVDVRPSSYPNIIRLSNQRFLVAIPGITGDEGFFDTIDKLSFNIQGIPALGVRSRLSDFTTVGTDLVTDSAICQTGLPDGNNDLIVVWDSAAVISLFPDAQDGTQIPITIQAKLLDGTPIFGNDFIVIER